MIATAQHASGVGVLVAPVLVALMVAPAFIARAFFGWGDDDDAR